jgi:hypothetical protein
VPVVATGLQNQDRAADYPRRGFDTLFLRQPFGLYRRGFVPARLVPVWRLALWANARLAHCALARHPFVLAARAAEALYFDRGDWHEHKLYPDVIDCQGYYQKLFP